MAVLCRSVGFEVGGVVQGVLGAWVQLCEAVASWRLIQDEGLRNELSVIMQAFKANLVSVLHSPLSMSSHIGH